MDQRSPASTRDVQSNVSASFFCIFLFPFAPVWEIVPEHGSGGLRLVEDAQRDIAFAQPHQRLFDVTRGLILGHHNLEAVDGADEVTLVEVKAPDIHLLASDLI